MTTYELKDESYRKAHLKNILVTKSRGLVIDMRVHY